MRKITRNPFLANIRDILIIQMRKGGKIKISLERGLYLDEVGEIFRLGESRISQIEKKIKGRIK